MINAQQENKTNSGDSIPDDFLNQSSILYASNPPTVIPLIGVSSDSEIIYEINLSVPKETAIDYVNWLRDFTKNLCEITPGFTSCNVYSQPKPAGLHWLSEEGDSKYYLTVHYHISSQEYLKEYLKVEQPDVAKAEIDRFKFNVISRRVLRNLLNTSA
ncbi:hypothetical protein H8356DRAFT_14814 [Neocallimastix lanati (nom. inval.)]|jgi:hypothetical protein|uniref:ABM domain-containing protein n=1 Tax=Neocallimastix californiae TaxID=1754190 RepID=A0A1Y2BDR2_9FUNG|nr:hypothetical protein H8356DRAFT_14814 [Neocallimastix sp. JGI-2020a]ORY32969.1 hypothetical protein LY90DRAFT_705164 [Neocallimastix californiae]ORY32978.1 hypothetical protein LY90DRAFT_673471 [Neocallimastix californiae]|eukprot:ORY32969.1 hypothetical protein LY90DRAFT_705164 [Neocallimastix californiae]